MASPLSRTAPQISRSKPTFFAPSYQEDFGPKTAQRVQCIRTGSSSGNRRNNPHPPNDFMIWRYAPNQFVPDHAVGAVASAPIPPMNPSCPSTNIASTYQVDFERPSTRLRPVSSHPHSCKGSRRTAELRSTQTWSFQTPKPTSRLRSNTTRYGCSTGKILPACGAVPTISSGECRLFASQDTSYRESYQSEKTCHLPKIPSSVTGQQQCSSSGVGRRGGYQPSWLSQWTGPA